MKNHPQSEHLSWGDTVFLNLEREGMPLNVASVSVLEGEIPFADCLQLIESKLPSLPRYLERVVAPPLNIGLPTWEYDPSFDIRNHVREVTLKYGTDTELKALAGKLFSCVMDRQHPLWDITFVHGLKGKRTGLILRFHHCLADGIAGVGMMGVLMDADPNAPLLPRKKMRRHVPKPPDAIKSLVDGVVTSYSDFVKQILSGWTSLLDMAERTAANGTDLASDEASQLMPEITAFTERLRFNVLYRGPQKFAWADIPLADVKAMRQAGGASVNDVILTLVTTTIRRYLEFHGDSVKGRMLRMMVPVNLRGNDSASELGNRITILPVTVPLDIRNPRRLLAAVHQRTEFLKHSRAAELVSLTGGLVSMLPSAMQVLAGPMVSQVPFTPFNMVCTNVPGPQYPLYLLGHKMLRWYPYVPIGGEMALNCAILSYDGAMYFGFSGDVHAAPDLRRLESLLKSSFEELRDTVAVKSPQKRKTHIGAKARKTTKTVPEPTATVRVSVPLTVPPPSVKSVKVTQPVIVKEDEIVAQMTA